MHIRNYKFKVNPTISLFTKVSSCLLSRSTPSEQPGVKQEKLLVPWITKAFQHPFKLLYKVLNLIPWQCFCNHLTNSAQGDVMLWKQSWATMEFFSWWCHAASMSVSLVLLPFTDSHEHGWDEKSKVVSQSIDIPLSFHPLSRSGR